MWRSSSSSRTTITLLKRTLLSSSSSAVPTLGFRLPDLGFRHAAGAAASASEISYWDAKKVMRLVNVEALKKKLGTDGKEVMEYKDLLETSQTMGVAKTRDEAEAFVRVLDEAGVVCSGGFAQGGMKFISICY